MNSTWVSIYGAVVATIVLIWRIYEFLYDRRGRIKVTIGTQSQIPVMYDNSLGKTEVFLNITVTNIGKNTRYIEVPRLKVHPKINGQPVFSFIDTDSKIKYPLELSPGKVHEVTYPLNSIVNNLKAKGIKQIKAYVKDSHSKGYHSKWLILN